MRLNSAIYLPLFLVLFSCGNPTPKEEKASTTKSEALKPAAITTEESGEVEKPDKSAVNLKKQFAGYEFRFGYKKYDPDSFDNPGYLRVLRDGKIIFEDTFEGEGDVSVKSFGNHKLAGKKLVFTLNYGTAACDYTQTSRYYIIDTEHQVHALKDCYASCGGDGYACHIFKHTFPEDSLGKPNTIFFAEGFVYNEHDQEDRIDTTQISFSKGSFKVKKLTNHVKQDN